MLFKDNINNKSNQKNIGVIKSSNLCVSGETKILTDKGYYDIKDLANTDVRVWNGNEFSETTVRKTGVNQDLLNIEFSNGLELKCTPYHKFHVIDYNKRKYTKKSIKIEAQELKEGMKLIKFDLPIVKDNKKINMKYPYTHGFFCADGTYNNNNNEEHNCKFKSLEGSDYCKRHQYLTNYNVNNIDNEDKCNAKINIKKPLIYLYDEKKKLIDYIKCRDGIEPFDNNNKTVITLPCDIEDKYFVPINYSLDTKLRWLEGYFDGDGSIAKNNNTYSLQASSINKKFLKKIVLLLQTIGIQSRINLSRKEGLRNLPDQKGSYKLYNCKTIYRILISTYNLYKLVELGFSPKRLIVNDHKPNREASEYIKVKSITKLEEKEDTYCFTEEKLGRGIFNGIIAGNCAEILEYSDEKEYAVCTLASVSLSTYVNKDGKFDYDKLIEIMGVLVRNLNKVIDINYYPVPETKLSNERHRPIGIGVQGLADVFIKMKLPFDSPEALEVNNKIFETMYYGAMLESHKLSLKDGPYSTFKGSPLSKGLFQFDLWGVKPKMKYDWDTLRKNIMRDGVRNSLCIALMPTASTSQILGNNECFEPFTSNIYVRRTIAGDFMVINEYLIRDLVNLNLWNKDMKDRIIYYNGSIQKIEEIPENLKKIYKTAWEIKQKALIDLSIGRGPFVCQTQSLNLFFEEPSHKTLTSAFFYGWSKGLKTGSYYIRSRPKIQAQQFSLDANKIKQLKAQETKYEVCEACSA